MAITIGSNKFSFLNEWFLLLKKYDCNVKDEKDLKQAVDDTSALFRKYDSTDAHIHALWCCYTLREILNEQLMSKKSSEK